LVSFDVIENHLPEGTAFEIPAPESNPHAFNVKFVMIIKLFNSGFRSGIAQNRKIISLYNTDDIFITILISQSFVRWPWNLVFHFDL
jgi:hypothetical protein